MYIYAYRERACECEPEELEDVLTSALGHTHACSDSQKDISEDDAELTECDKAHEAKYRMPNASVSRF
jgi:hypothetical protein